jgi:hypothetical protein
MHKQVAVFKVMPTILVDNVVVPHLQSKECRTSSEWVEPAKARIMKPLFIIRASSWYITQYEQMRTVGNTDPDNNRYRIEGIQCSCLEIQPPI